MVQRTGWEVFAWALLDDHYHMVLRTPEPNLVAGMKWFQNFWTKRFNARHDRTGPVFGGRYKSVVVQEDGHLSALIDHVHLNPFRAGLADAARLAAHSWSSLRDYLLPGPSRRPWVCASKGLKHMGYDGQDSNDRLRYLEHLEGIAMRDGGRPDLPVAGRTLHSTFRRGWYLGGEAFRGKLLAAREGGGIPRAAGAHGHGAVMAQRILRAGLASAGLAWESLAELRKSDWRKRAIGRAIRLRTTVSTEWIASNLEMGISSRAAAMVARDPEPSWGKPWRAAKALLDQLLGLPYESACTARPTAPQDVDDETCCAGSSFCEGDPCNCRG